MTHKELVEMLVKEVLSLNPKAKELGEGKCLNMQNLAKLISQTTDTKGE